MENYKTEEQLQADCAQWFWDEFIDERRMLFHVDNNSYNRIIGAKKKALGVVQGPSDFIFICGTVVFIEMKLPGRKQTPEQIDFENKVKERGHEYYLMDTFAGFKRLIIKKLTLRL